MSVGNDYQVLARKWRPQRFADVAGQEHVVRTLANAVAAGRVAHAYLFCGPRGVGKTTAARLLARALQCSTGPTPSPCGTCSACVEIAAGNAVDVAEIDGASNNGVDDVRAIRENARYLPSRDRYKIYIIDEVHMLSTPAFNALLKTLEEPPPHVKFIFATTEMHKVPETILSRCQIHTFRRLPLAVVAAKLREIAKAEGFALDDETLSLLARQAEGGMRDALSLLDQIVSSCGPNPSPEAVAEALGAVDRRAVNAICAALCRRDATAVVSLLGEQHARGQEAKRVAAALCEELRDVLVAKVTGTPPAELPDHEQKEIAALAKEADPAQLARLFDLVHRTLGDLSRAFEPQLALEVALLQGVFLAPGAQVADLLARVEALAAAGPVAAAAPKAPAAPVRAPPPPAAAAPVRRAEPPLARRDDPSLPTTERLAALVAAAIATSPRLGTALKHGRLRALAPGELSLAYPAGDFRAALLVSEKAAIDALLSAHFGEPTVLRLFEGEVAGTEPSLAEREARGAAAHAAAVREAASSSEAVRETLRVLGGTIEEVRVLADPVGRK